MESDRRGMMISKATCSFSTTQRRLQQGATANVCDSIAAPTVKRRRRGLARVDTAHQTEAPPMFLEGYSRMQVIRLFETSMHRLFLAGEIHGTTHLSAGQEAVAVGTCMALRPDDWVAGTYRGHGHALAQGTRP